jgi:hypothetical protein
MIAISATYEVRRHWTVFMIGVALFVGGVIRRRLGGPSASERRDSGAR